MSNLVVLLVVALAAVCIQAMPKPDPEPRYSQTAMFAPFDFESFFKMPSFPDMPTFPLDPIPVASPDDIKNLKGDPNTHVSGSFKSSSSSFESVNGVPVVDSHHGREITNDDGKVEDHQY